ncbi:MAG TPA: glycosyltransferase family 2 protein [Terriglobia bacterium]|jgi:GT2 family glycosyltransferase|nr:glycosyltransferase family 2 protein [Terriglobia bacterium]
MDISICVLTHHQPELLPRCLACCLAEIERAGVVGEVILIDNASTDGSPQSAAALFPGVRIIRNEQNLSFSAANNEAIRASRGRSVLILNDDALLQEGSLGLMVRKLDGDPAIGALAPKLLNVDGSPQWEYDNRRFPHLRHIVCEVLGLDRLMLKTSVTRSLFTLSKDPNQGGEAEHLAGACLLVRREVLDRVGMFDEGFPLWFEDTDLCYRIKEAGWGLFYLEEARVIHYGTATTSGLAFSRRVSLYTKSLTRYFAKHSGFLTCLLLRLILFLTIALKTVKAALGHLLRPGSSQAEYRDVMAGSLKALRVVLLEWN